MKGDFSRDTFDPANHFSRVLSQQGRVQVDADANEQAAILLHYLRALAADLIGPHGGPQDGLGFEIVVAENNVPSDEQKRLREAKVLPLAAGDFLIAPGHYYVGGLLCENERYVSYKTQSDYPIASDSDAKNTNGGLLVYLDVWERHLSYLEVEDADGTVISPREVALGGPDTATRARVVWQVKARPSKISAADAHDYQKFIAELGVDGRPGTSFLKARAIQPASALDDPCSIPPDARYRGAENQLYRVEVHVSSAAAQAGRAPAPTFKWSRENASVIFAVQSIEGARATLVGLGHDSRGGLRLGDWVEIVDDNYTLQNRAESLLQVDTIDYDEAVVTFTAAPDSAVGQDTTKHPLLRRWDQRADDASEPTQDGIAIVEGIGEQNWIELEEGLH